MIDIDGVVFKEYSFNKDNRGWLIEVFRADECLHQPAMSYISETLPGVARGPHEHEYQTDYFVFIGPGLFDLYLWDARASSLTYGNKTKIKCGENRPCSVLIPPGVVHAYKNVSDRPGWVLNLPDRLYAGPYKEQPVDEIRHESNPDSPYKIDD